MACLAASVAAISSASQDDSATISCLHEHHDIGLVLR